MPYTFLRHRFQSLFLAGFLVVMPLAAAITVTVWLFHLVDGIVAPVVRTFLRLLGLPEPHTVVLTVIGLAATVVLVALVGLVSTNFLGRKFVQLSDWTAHKIPIFGTIYHSVKQIIETLAFMEKRAFQEAVLVEYPCSGVFSLGFVTNESKEDLVAYIGSDVVTLFVPTAPNPTSGFVIMVPRSSTIPVDITVEEAMRYVLSAGVVKIRPARQVPFHRIPPLSPQSVSKTTVGDVSTNF